MNRRFNPLRRIIALFAWVMGLFLLSSCSAEDTRSVTVVGYNYTERPIYTFSVNGAGGSNLFAKEKHGGGAFSCCTEITVGKPAVIKWVYDTTEKQYEAGLREENHSTTITVPPPTVSEASYLEVHFYPDHHVELALVKFPGKARWSEIKNPGELHE
jgi:Protein of unknown function (DUF3304)